jgi:hypothetical protein
LLPDSFASTGTRDTGQAGSNPLFPLAPAETAAGEPTRTPDAVPVTSTGTLGRELRVTAPAGADVWVDGVRVGQGDWHSERIKAGKHQIAATLRSVPGCTAAHHETTVRVRTTGTTTIALTPKPCGYLTLDALPAGARWTVVAPSGDEVQHGTVPHSKPIVLPTGSYTLRVSASYCADFRADFAITSGESHHEYVRLICG